MQKHHFHQESKPPIKTNYRSKRAAALPHATALHSTLAPLGIILSFTLFSGLVLSNHNIFAESSNVNAHVSVASACSMTGTVDVSHNATVSAGTYTADIGTTTISTFCGDQGGYAVYAVGYTNDTIGSTILANGSNGDPIATGTATSGTSSAWSMKLTPSGTALRPTIVNNFDTYHAVPSAHTKVAEYASNTNSGNGSNFTATYAVYAAPTQVAGTYTGQVKYTMLHPGATDSSCLTSACLTVNFDSGITRAVIKSGSPSGATVATITTSGTTISSGLTAGVSYYILPVYATGYSLASLTEDQNDAGAIASGTYGYYYHTAAVGNNAVAITTQPIASVGAMQNLASSQCTANPVLVTDSRGGINTGNGVYTIQRLADGNCWMLNNLALGANASVNSTNTNNPSTTNDSANGKIAFNSTPESTSGGFNVYNAARINTDSATTAYSYGDGSVNAGVYYNYCAASAGQYCYASGAGVDIQGTLVDTTGDLCPAGWRMPTGGDNAGENATLGQGEYYQLYNAYNNDVANFRNALRTPFSGYFDGDAAYDQGTRGDFLSSTYYSAFSMYRLFVSASNIGPAYVGGRVHGFSIRCILK